MKNQKPFALALAAAMALSTIAAPVSVLAAENTNIGKTTVTVTKETEEQTPSYTLTVPAKLEVTQAGFTESRETVKVMADDSSRFHGRVRVRLQSGNDGVFINKENAKEELPYKIKKNADVTGELETIMFLLDEKKESHSDDFLFANIGETGAAFGVDIAESDWNAASDGTYEDVITFEAEYFAD